jgi:DNA-binding IclR family transcriptional regulator
MEASAQNAMLERNKAFQGLGPAKRRRVKSELARIGDAGFCLAPSAYRTGIDASCLVGSAAVGVIAALGVPFVSGGTNHGNEKRLVSVIQKFAKRITSAMGLSSEPLQPST